MVLGKVDKGLGKVVAVSAAFSTSPCGPEIQAKEMKELAERRQHRIARCEYVGSGDFIEYEALR